MLMEVKSVDSVVPGNNLCHDSSSSSSINKILLAMIYNILYRRVIHVWIDPIDGSICQMKEKNQASLQSIVAIFTINYCHIQQFLDIISNFYQILSFKKFNFLPSPPRETNRYGFLSHLLTISL